MPQARIINPANPIQIVNSAGQGAPKMNKSTTKRRNTSQANPKGKRSRPKVNPAENKPKRRRRQPNPLNVKSLAIDSLYAMVGNMANTAASRFASKVLPIPTEYKSNEFVQAGIQFGTALVMGYVADKIPVLKNRATPFTIGALTVPAGTVTRKALNVIQTQTATPPGEGLQLAGINDVSGEEVWTDGRNLYMSDGKFAGALYLP
jgi:hypothetical protein